MKFYAENSIFEIHLQYVRFFVSKWKVRLASIHSTPRQLKYLKLTLALFVFTCCIYLTPPHYKNYYAFVIILSSNNPANQRARMIISSIKNNFYKFGFQTLVVTNWYNLFLENKIYNLRWSIGPTADSISNYFDDF